MAHETTADDTSNSGTSKLWGGRFTEATDEFVQVFTASVNFDQRLASQDIRGSLAHADMLQSVGVLSQADATTIASGLQQIQQEIDMLRVERGDDPEEETDDRVLADLLKLPPCLDTPALQSKRAPRPETEALHDVQTYLRANGLVFEDRTLNAFHTALKISEVSPLTVLAGISGTGKRARSARSQFPLSSPLQWRVMN